MLPSLIQKLIRNRTNLHIYTNKNLYVKVSMLYNDNCMSPCIIILLALNWNTLSMDFSTTNCIYAAIIRLLCISHGYYLLMIVGNLLSCGGKLNLHVGNRKGKGSTCLLMTKIVSLLRKCLPKESQNLCQYLSKLH